MDPARTFKESLTSRPELENSQGQSRHFDSAPRTSALPRSADIADWVRQVREVPIADSCTAATGGSIDHLVVAREHSSFGQPRLPKTLSHQLRV